MKTIGITIEVSAVSGYPPDGFYQRICDAVTDFVGPSVSVIVVESRLTVVAQRLIAPLEADGPYVEIKYRDLVQTADPLSTALQTIKSRIERSR